MEPYQHENEKTSLMTPFVFSPTLNSTRGALRDVPPSLFSASKELTIGKSFS